MEQNGSTDLWSQHNIPTELWPNILSRLPTISLLRFRSVSHPWKLLIDDPAFARYHLTNFNNNNNNKSNLLLLQRTNQDTIAITASILTLNDSDTSPDDPRNPLPHLEHLQNCDVVGSADGVYMVLDGVYQTDYGELGSEMAEDCIPKLMLWNPSIRKVRNVPSPPNLLQLGNCYNLGIGFDPSIDDYKFVRIWMEDEYTTPASVAIYTFGTDSWKETPFNGDWRFDGMFVSLYFLPRIVCFRGVLYFISKTLTSGSVEVVSFHFSSQDFTYASLPVDQDVVYDHLDVSSDLALVDGGIGGSLLAVVLIQDNNVAVWAWDGIGAEPMTWSKLYTFGLSIPEELPEYNPRIPWMPKNNRKISLVYLKSDGEMIIQWGGWDWYCWVVASYNLETHVEKAVLKNGGNSAPVLKLYDHIESLMLLN